MQCAITNQHAYSHLLHAELQSLLCVSISAEPLRYLGCSMLVSIHLLWTKIVGTAYNTITICNILRMVTHFTLHMCLIWVSGEKSIIVRNSRVCFVILCGLPDCRHGKMNWTLTISHMSVETYRDAGSVPSNGAIDMRYHNTIKTNTQNDVAENFFCHIFIITSIGDSASIELPTEECHSKLHFAPGR